jgi:hypothetical protein
MEGKQLIYFPQRSNGEGEDGTDSRVCCGRCSHPHRHVQRKASGIFHRVGAIGMARRGNNWHGLASMRMKGIPGGRYRRCRGHRV